MSDTGRDSGYVDNWQTGMTVTECNLHMLTTEDCSDVIFRVGPEKHVVRAHRYVLVSRSCVFYAMFCGPLAEKGEVTLPDIDPNIFKEFLRYVYTDTATIIAENVTGLLYTSRKYAVDALFNLCTTFLEKSLSEGNVCQILEQCHGYGELDLEQKALKILTEAGEKVVKSAGFLDLCSNCLGKFLSSPQLKLKEEVVFTAALSWSREKCKRENVSATSENLKKYLGENRYEIRFAELSLEYLVNKVGPSGILAKEERVDIMDKAFQPDKDITPFKSGPRKCLETRSIRVTSPASVVSRYTKRSDFCRKCTNNAVSFRISEDIQLLGCHLYGPARLLQFSYEMNILLYNEQNQVIAEPVPTTHMELKGHRELNVIMFPDPVPLVAGRTYTIYVKMNGTRTNYGVEGQRTVDVDGVTFEFSGSNLNGDGPQTDIGQIPGLIWR